MTTSTWDVPSLTPSTMRRMNVDSPARAPFPTLSDASYAPVVLSRGEVSILLGESWSDGYAQPGPAVCRRIYLADTLVSSSQTGSTYSASAARPTVPHRSASSSFSSNVSGLARAEGSASTAHLDFVNADDLNTGRDCRTTFMIRRLPRYLTSEQVLLMLNKSGYLCDAVDLIYVPVFTGKAHANRGYAFINFRSPQLGALFMTVVQHSTETELSKQLGRCDIVYAHIQSKEGMLANLIRVRCYWEDPSVPPGLVVMD